MKNLTNKPHQKGISTPNLWVIYLSNSRFRVMAAFCLVFLAFSIRYITKALAIIDTQSGKLLYDPIHALLPAAIDLSSIIFLLTYSSVFIVFIDLFLKSPIQLVRLGFAIGVMKILRSISMFLVPLEPPAGIVPLQDPIVTFITTNHVVALRDLFFSGHCATMMILLLFALSPLVKKWMRFAVIAVPCLILWQRVHYTVDIIAGLAVGFGIYKFIMNFVTIKELELKA